jgi:tryptophanyl-tRNA synthetase
VQHLELARELARRFNRRVGADVFPEPQPLLSKVTRLKGLDGSAKMSKSKGNTVALGEAPDAIRAKIKVAVTDPARLRRYDPGHPEVCGIYALHQSFSAPERVAVIDRTCRSAELGCVDCKKELADRVVEHLAPIRERLEALRAKPAELQAVLADGAQRAGAVARATMEQVRAHIGVRPSR